MKLQPILLILAAAFLPAACSDSGSSLSQGPISPVGGANGPAGQGDWLIPESEVLDGGPGKDGIPSIDNPVFVTARDPQGRLSWMDDEDLILAIKIGDEIRGYPHPVLDWHEIINDDLGETSVAITYCPLTGTGIGWDRMVDGRKTTFGVSGLLYNSNLIPYDRATDSYWSQMRLDCVNGALIGTEAQTYQLVELPWKLWREWFPDAKVAVGSAAGLARPYDRYPYNDYRTQSGTLFPVDGQNDNRLPDKERVLGIIQHKSAFIFPFSAFTAEKVNVRTASFGEERIVAFGSNRLNFLVAYYTKLEDGTPIEDFTPISNEDEIVARDSEGNKWNIFGEAVSGPRQGRRLQPTGGLIGYWFTWPAFYKDTRIFGF